MALSLTATILSSPTGAAQITLDGDTVTVTGSIIGDGSQLTGITNGDGIASATNQTVRLLSSGPEHYNRFAAWPKLLDATVGGTSGNRPVQIFAWAEGGHFSGAYIKLMHAIWSRVPNGGYRGSMGNENNVVLTGSVASSLDWPSATRERGQHFPDRASNFDWRVWNTSDSDW